MSIENKIKSIHNILKDYRAEDNDGKGMVDKERIETWINQFKLADRQFILDETARLLKNRYLPKKNIEKTLLGAIKTMAENSGYSKDVKSFLKNAIFLDQQPSGKSQGIILELLENLIEKYQIGLLSSNLGDINNHSVDHFIYLDDILCTGNTFYQDIEEFLLKKNSSGKQYFTELISDKIHLHCCFIFFHQLNGDKKKSQLGFSVSESLPYHPNFHYYAKNRIDNFHNGALEFLKPSESNQSNLVMEYMNKVNKQVDSYINNKFTTTEEYFRPQDVPNEESFFINKSNRDRYTNILLEKGIEIINSGQSSKQNIRPLGYSLPSIRDFGYGTICFTWRNVPNNTPLVFWYSTDTFTPLFPKKSTNIQVMRVPWNDDDDLIKVDLP